MSYLTLFFAWMCFFGSLASAQIPSPRPTPPSSASQQPTDSATPQPSARSFEGRVVKIRGQFLLEDKAGQTSYSLDDQSKAKKYEGKTVKIMGTIDDRKSNLLHVIDITSAADPE